jgi:predicted dehydrogenase
MDTSAYAMELYGSEGRLIWRGDQAWWLPQPHFIPDGEHDRWEALESIYPESYQSDSSASEADYWFVEEYVRALDEGREHECSGLEGRRVLEVLMGIFESAAYGTRVDLPQENREHPLRRWRKEAALEPPAEMPRPYRDWLSTEFERFGR